MKTINLDRFALQVQVRDPSAEGRTHVCDGFRLPKLNTRKFEAFAEENGVQLNQVDVQQLFEDFRLRNRHLQKGDPQKRRSCGSPDRFRPHTTRAHTMTLCSL